MFGVKGQIKSFCGPHIKEMLISNVIKYKPQKTQFEQYLWTVESRLKSFYLTRNYCIAFYTNPFLRFYETFFFPLQGKT